VRAEQSETFRAISCEIERGLSHEALQFLRVEMR
jgi:hypothetical protein